MLFCKCLFQPLLGERPAFHQLLIHLFPINWFVHQCFEVFLILPAGHEAILQRSRPQKAPNTFYCKAHSSRFIDRNEILMAQKGKANDMIAVTYNKIAD